MQPYVNPNFFNQPQYNPYQPQNNPYMDRAMSVSGNYGQAQQQQIGQMPVITSYIVDTFDNIHSSVVPMDNNGAIFIKRDGSEMQHRIWGNMGNIEIASYKKVIEESPVNVPTEEEKAHLNALETALSGISARLEEVYAKIDEMSLKQPKTNAGSKQKKEGEGNE